MARARGADDSMQLRVGFPLMGPVAQSQVPPMGSDPPPPSGRLALQKFKFGGPQEQLAAVATSKDTNAKPAAATNDALHGSRDQFHFQFSFNNEPISTSHVTPDTEGSSIHLITCQTHTHTHTPPQEHACNLIPGVTTHNHTHTYIPTLAINNNDWGAGGGLEPDAH